MKKRIEKKICKIIEYSIIIMSIICFCYGIKSYRIIEIIFNNHGDMVAAGANVPVTDGGGSSTKTTTSPTTTTKACSDYPPYNCPSSCYKTATSCSAPTPTATSNKPCCDACNGIAYCLNNCQTCSTTAPSATATPSPCPAGTYGTPDNCTTCPAGSECPSEGMSEPTACTDNTYSEAGASSCTECSKGRAMNNHTTCEACEITSVGFGSNALTVGKESIVHVTTNAYCAGKTINTNMSHGSVTGTYGPSGGVMVVHVKPTDACEVAVLTASFTASDGDGNYSTSKSAPMPVYYKDWKVECTTCSEEKGITVALSQATAEKISAGFYGENCEINEDGEKVCDKIYSRTCGKPKQYYNYCCVDNELPGLSNIAFPVRKAGSKDCKAMATKNGYPALDHYTLIEDSKMSLDDCHTPPPVPGTCQSSGYNIGKNTPEYTKKCEDTVEMIVEDDAYCTNNDNNENKSFYNISCKKTIKTQFEYGDDDNTNTSNYLNKGQGFAFGIYVNTVVNCTHTFFANIWKNVIDRFIEKVELIDRKLVPFINGNKPDEWKNYIDNNLIGKLKEDNIKYLYELWRIVDNLKTIVNDYNSYNDVGMNNNYNESATLDIMDLDTASEFIRNVINEGTVETRVNKVHNLGMEGITNPKDLTVTSKDNPRRVKLLPKKACVNKASGEVSIISEEKSCDENSLQGGNRYYIGYNTEPGEYEMTISVNGLGTNNSEVVNEKCAINVLKDDLLYRPIEVKNPFINDKWKKGMNWVNDMYDFTQIIH